MTLNSSAVNAMFPCLWETSSWNTEQKIKFSINDFFSKCDQIHKKLQIWSSLLKKSLMENFLFCVVGLMISCKIFHKKRNYEYCLTTSFPLPILSTSFNPKFLFVNFRYSPINESLYFVLTIVK